MNMKGLFDFDEDGSLDVTERAVEHKVYRDSYEKNKNVQVSSCVTEAYKAPKAESRPQSETEYTADTAPAEKTAENSTDSSAQTNKADKNSGESSDSYGMGCWVALVLGYAFFTVILDSIKPGLAGFVILILCAALLWKKYS